MIVVHSNVNNIIKCYSYTFPVVAVEETHKYIKQFCLEQTLLACLA